MSTQEQAQDQDLEKQINAELQQEEDSELKTMAKAAIKVNRQSQALRVKWIERRTIEQTELKEIEQKIFQALKDRDKKELKYLTQLTCNVGKTDSLDGYHNKYGKIRRNEIDVPDEDYDY